MRQDFGNDVKFEASNDDTIDVDDKKSEVTTLMKYYYYYCIFLRSVFAVIKNMLFLENGKTTMEKKIYKIILISQKKVTNN
jgi:hypothetical protein